MQNLQVKKSNLTIKSMKYKLTENSIKFENKKLYQIQALKDFGDVKAGDLGGYIEMEANLSQEGNCWVYDDAKVFDNAKVWGDAELGDNAKVGDNVMICDDATFYELYGNDVVSDDADCDDVYLNAQVYGSDNRLLAELQLSRKQLEFLKKPSLKTQFNLLVICCSDCGQGKYLFENLSQELFDLYLTADNKALDNNTDKACDKLSLELENSIEITDPADLRLQNLDGVIVVCILA